MVRQYTVVNILVISLAGAAFIGIFLYWSRRNITRPILQLEKSAVSFADHSHGQRDIDALSFEAPAIKTENEIKSLSDAVVKMTEDMRDYVRDVVSAEQKAANMQELANRDSLTGIRNKTAYDSEIKHVSVKLEDGETKVGLAIVDLNYLKKVNDTYGHDKGNLYIKKLCHIVCVIFEHSPVFRIGGDEFAIILRGGDYDHYSELEARFNAEIEAMARDDTLEPWERVSAAIGAAFYDTGLDEDMDSLFKRADHVMYGRKKEMNAVRKD